ncbi:hypothetical protein RhiTH_010699 [Rhizoctonia solani]
MGSYGVSTKKTFLSSLGRGNGPVHHSIRLYIMTLKRLGSIIYQFESQGHQATSVRVAQSAQVLARLCTYICSRYTGWNDWSRDHTVSSAIRLINNVAHRSQMSVLMVARKALSRFWGRNYHLLSGDACASVVMAELRIIFLTLSSVWITPNDKRRLDLSSILQFTAFYNLDIGRTTLLLMRHSNGKARLGALKLGGLMDEIVRSTRSTADWGLALVNPSYRSYSGASHSDHDVTLQGGEPLIIDVPAGNASRTKCTLHPLDYGITGELIQVLFPRTKVHPKPLIQQKVDFALRTIIHVVLNEHHHPEETPLRYDFTPNRTTEPVRLHKNVEFFMTSDVFDKDQPQVICNQIFASWPWPRNVDKSFEEQTASQLLAIAALYVLNIESESNQFPTPNHVLGILSEVHDFGQKIKWTAWPRSFHWLTIKAFNVQMRRGNKGDWDGLEDSMARLVVLATPHIGIETSDELNDLILMLSNQTVDPSHYQKLDAIFQDLAKSPADRQWCYSHYFHRLEPLPKLLLLAVYNPGLKTSIVNFVTSLMYMDVGESREIDNSAQLDVCALESFLLVANFAMLPSFPVSDQENPIATEDIPSFANAALRLLADHSPSSLESDPERTKILEGLQYVWEKVRGESIESLDLSLESVRDKLRVVANPPVEATEAPEETPEDDESSPNPQNEA